MYILYKMSNHPGQCFGISQLTKDTCTYTQQKTDKETNEKFMKEKILSVGWTLKIIFKPLWSDIA